MFSEKSEGISEFNSFSAAQTAPLRRPHELDATGGVCYSSVAPKRARRETVGLQAAPRHASHAGLCSVGSEEFDSVIKARTAPVAPPTEPLFNTMESTEPADPRAGKRLKRKPSSSVESVA